MFKRDLLSSEGLTGVASGNKPLFGTQSTVKNLKVVIQYVYNFNFYSYSQLLLLT